jgi:hypothetical protein
VWSTVESRSGITKQSIAAGTYIITMGTDNLASGTSVNSAAAGVIRLDAADFAMTGRTTKLKVKATITTNGTAPTGTLTVGLYPVSSVAGASNTHSITTGTVVASSTVAFAAPTANNVFSGDSAEFTMPADGAYVLAVNLSGATAANSFEEVTARLMVRHV